MDKEVTLGKSAKTALGSRMNRRTFTGAAAGAAIAGPALLRAPHAAARQETTQLDFTIWNYAADIVQDNINLFQEINPEITVQLSDFGWPVFHETMVNRFISQTPTDVTYNGGNWLNEFAAAGWVVSLDDHFDWAQSYKD
jgi:multiple sugar transport system substrate-binding protein